MIKPIETNGKVILELSRFDRLWVCSECNKEYSIAPEQCSCGASDKVFLEKSAEVKESPRKEYLVKFNFLYEASEVKKGTIVSLQSKDRITKNLLLRKLIEEIIDKKEVKA